MNRFDIHAYFDTAPLGIPLSGQQYEFSAYGIGTSDARFAIANPLANISGNASTENSSSGVGWYYEQYQNGETNSSKLLLVEFGEGGNSHPNNSDWNIIQTIDVSVMTAGWYRLGVDYDPETGDVVARFGDTIYEFTTDANMFGNFYVGYRDQTGAQDSHPHLLNPPIFDIVVLPGDYNNDGLVDTDDYLEWKDAYGQMVTVAGSGADGNGDGKVDAADYIVWRNNLTAPGELGAAGLQAVPEPKTLAFVLLAGLAAWGLWRVYTSDARRARV